MRQLKVLVCVFVSLFSLLLVGCFPNNHDAVKEEVLLQGRTMVQLIILKW